MKKIYLIFVSFTLIFASCINIKFEEPQPQGGENLAIIPKKLQGTFLIDKNDTLFLYANKMEIKQKDTTQIVKFSENLVLRKFQDYYVINQRDDIDSTWSAFFVKIEKKQNPIFYLMSYDSKDSSIIDKLPLITKTKIINKNGSVDLIIKPTAKELAKIIDEIGMRELKLPKLSQ